jgi:glycosyltransferase involved in cell wall biosynthesis
MNEAAHSPEVSVVVPLFNEEGNISILQSELRTALTGIDHEIIFVDDGSVDRTADKIERAPNVRTLRIEKNTGQSAALYIGCKAADGATIVMIDGDLQNDPADIPRLLTEISRGADMVCGYRKSRKDPLLKRIVSRVANFVRSRYAKDGIRDTGCTLKAMRRECRDALVPFQGMHRFIASLVKGAGYRIVEIPVNHRPRHFGQSKYAFGSRGFKTVRDLFGVRWLLDRRLDYKVRDE